MNEVKVNVIHSGVGAMNESDVMLATASNAIIIGFNVRPTPKAKINFKKFSIFLTPFFKFVFTIPYYRIIGKIKGTKSQLFDIFIDKYLILSLIQLPF